jgi:prevent-host-death family protein
LDCGFFHTWTKLSSLSLVHSRFGRGAIATATVGESKALKVVNIHEAKTHLSRLVEEAASGESFIIAKAGKPMVKVIRLDTEHPDPPKHKSRLEPVINFIPLFALG